MAHTGRSEVSSAESVLSFHFSMGSRDQILQVFRLTQQACYHPLSHLTSPEQGFFTHTRTRLAPMIWNHQPKTERNKHSLGSCATAHPMPWEVFCLIAKRDQDYRAKSRA